MTAAWQIVQTKNKTQNQPYDKEGNFPNTFDIFVAQLSCIVLLNITKMGNAQYSDDESNDKAFLKKQTDVSDF